MEGMDYQATDVTFSFTDESAVDWDMVEAQLPECWQELAEEEGLVNQNLPSHIGAKVTDIGQILRLIFFHVATNSSLRVTTAMAAAANIVTISSVALHKWMRKVGPYVAKLLALMTNAKEIFAPHRWAGYDIRVVDATTVTRPGACTTTARVHYSMKLTTLRPDQIKVTDETGGETFRRFEVGKRQLWMGDRGYANPPGIASVCSKGGDVLVRHNRGSLPLYGATGKRIDVLKKLFLIKKAGQIREWSVWVHPTRGERIRGRLCVVRLPADKAREARDRLRKEQGAKVTEDSLKGAEFVAVFTTIPRARLSKERVMELYSLRWQVELHIKRDKSIAGLDKLPNFREDTILTWICTKLLLTQISRQISTPEVFFPR